jgi:glyoxylase-like metal-dependent hydrolase (beta-lactamase superfamily II)
VLPIEPLKKLEQQAQFFKGDVLCTAKIGHCVNAQKPPMRVHHLNCISTCPLGGRLMDGQTKSIVERGHLTCHCLLIETQDGLVLVDTGFGLRDVDNPKSRLSKFFLTLVRPEFREEMTAIRQVERLGFKASDVRHIILTHLDFDHAGGLDDFPHADVHMLQQERDYAVLQKTWLDRQRFRPQQWSTRGNWRVYEVDKGESWFGFEHVHRLEGLTPDLVLLPLLGHTHGHCGVAVEVAGQWLLLAGDAYFYHREMDVNAPECTPGLRLYQMLMEKDRKARLRNQERLRDLRRDHGTEVEIFCSHDLHEFERLSGHSARIPAEQMVH